MNSTIIYKPSGSRQTELPGMPQRSACNTCHLPQGVCQWKWMSCYGDLSADDAGPDRINDFAQSAAQQKPQTDASGGVSH
jgi:hypothetical protein